jgi:signal transduction histidine kinase
VPVRRSLPQAWLQRHDVAWWEPVVLGAALLAAAVAVWTTLAADFLRYPGWLAVQKADIILGPVVVGLYWHRRRPQSAYGPLLIAFGFLMVPYILQSVDEPVAFGTGVAWEGVIFVATEALILAFPAGRLRSRADQLIVAVAALTVAGPFITLVLISPLSRPDGSISGCLAACPENGLHAFTGDPGFAHDLAQADRIAIVAIALSTIALIVWRFARGTPPRRRAYAIGAPVALLFLVMQAGYQGLNLLDEQGSSAHEVFQWGIVVARASLWYGFLCALIAAELFAGRVLRRIIRRSLNRPAQDELEAMLRGPLGDPGLRLAFWDADAGAWTDAEGATLEPPAPASGRMVTQFRREGRPAAAIFHDAALADDAELLQASGDLALLAVENSELDAGWNEALRALRGSRARIAAASDVERLRLERDLHDGAQQRLVVLRIKLGITGDLVADHSAARARLTELERELDEAIDQLRDLAHGIYPPLLADMGLVAALRAVAMQSPLPVSVRGEVTRHPAEVESAIYYCCLEAIQNATKHGGSGARIHIEVGESEGVLRFVVSDDGAGFDVLATRDGFGLRNMRDRLGALDGDLQVVSAPGAGTQVSGQVALAAEPSEPERGRPVAPAPG